MFSLRRHQLLVRESFEFYQPVYIHNWSCYVLRFLPSADIYESFFYDGAVWLFLPTSHWPLYSGPIWHSSALANELLSHLFSHKCIFLVISFYIY